MKITRTFLATIALLAANLTTAFASATHGEVDTSLTYNSGILVLAFAGFLALIVVVQTIPAVVSLYGMIKKAAEASKQPIPEKVASRN